MSDNFFVYTDISCLPLTEHATYLGEGFGGLCTGGTAVIDLFSMRRQISKNDLVTILPFQLGSIHKVSDDFSMIFFKVDKVMFMDIMSSLGRITPDFFFHMRKNFQVPISVNEAKRFLGFCRAIDFRTNNDDPAFRRETILHLLRIYYWDFYVHFQKKTRKRNTPLLNSNKESIAMKFAMLVFENRETHREVAYYADQLCISPPVSYQNHTGSKRSVRPGYDCGLHHYRNKNTPEKRRHNDKRRCQTQRILLTVFVQPLFPQTHGHVPVGVPAHDPYPQVND